MKKMKTKKKILIIITTILLIVLAIFLAIYLYYNSKISKITHVDIPKKREELNIAPTIEKTLDDDYVNILLLGIDTRDPNTDTGRSDTNMILTLDKKHNKIKLASIMRDSLMTMKGQGPMAGQNQDRLNHAFAYGGAVLTLKTINENFKLNLQNYIKVDFAGLEKIIDYVGGVPINITSEEVTVANSYIKEEANLLKVKPTLITKAGLQNLNGMQALGYGRIRYVGNADYQRTERQRTVLDQLIKKLSSIGINKMPEVLDTLLPYTETSLNKGQINDLGSYVLLNKVSTIEQTRLPLDNASQWKAVYNNTYFLVWDKDKNIDALHKFIFEEDSDKSK